MSVDHLSKTVLVFAISAFAVAAAAGAADVRTYQFVSNERLLSFTGGIPGYNVLAQLAGSFDVEIESNGTATLTRFDVIMNDILNQGAADPGWSNGQLLAPVLFANPVGLTGVHDSTLIYLSSQPYPPPILVNGPATTITLVPTGGPWARLNIESFPTTLFDNPSFHTDAPTDVLTPGFVVQLVPEPSTFSIALLGVMATVPVARASSPNRPKRK